MTETRKRLIEQFDLDDETVFYEPADIFDPAIVGICTRIGQPTIVLYDRDRVIANLAADHEPDGEDDPYESAVEHFEYNVAGGWVGEYTPAFVTLLDPEQV